MKRLAIGIGVSILVIALTAPTFARGWGRGGGNCWRGNQAYGSYDREREGQLNEFDQTFYDEMSALRNDMWAKSRELDDVLNSSNPDVDRAKEIQKEMSELRAKMDQKRLDYQLEARKNGSVLQFGKGYGRGFGPGRGGYGRGMGYGPMGGGWN